MWLLPGEMKDGKPNSSDGGSLPAREILFDDFNYILRLRDSSIVSIM